LAPGIAAARCRNVATSQLHRDFAKWSVPHRLKDRSHIGVTGRRGGFVRLGLRAVRKTPCTAIFATGLGTGLGAESGDSQIIAEKTKA
jgi:hypothetical protein